MSSATDWQDLLRRPGACDHVVQIYKNREFLAESVAEYMAAGLRCGEAGLVIARPTHAEAFLRALDARGLRPDLAMQKGQLVVSDAESTLSQFMTDGWPSWSSFQKTVGGLIAQARQRYSFVRAYSEMAHIVWHDAKHEVAIMLEEFWNELARLQRFSLLCAYQMDPLDSRIYGGALEAVCNAHTHLLPAAEYPGLDEAVGHASHEVLDQRLTGMLLTLSSADRPATKMPLGQATLLWLHKHMPSTAAKVLSRVSARLGRHSISP